MAYGDSFTIGEKVTVYSSGYSSRVPMKIETVASVSARKLALCDGSHWTADGHRSWGSSHERWYSGPSVQKYREGDDETIERLTLTDKIKRFNDWSSASTQELRDASAIIRAVTARSAALSTKARAAR